MHLNIVGLIFADSKSGETLRPNDLVEFNIVLQYCNHLDRKERAGCLLYFSSWYFVMV